MTWCRAATRGRTVLAGLVCVVVLSACSGHGSSGHNAAPSGTPSSTSGSAGSTTSPSPTSSTGSSSGRSSTPAPAVSTVPIVPVSSRPPVPLRSRAPFGNGVSAKIVSIRHGKVTGNGPGVEAGRPDILCLIAITNRSSKTISLNTVQVSGYYGSSKTPAVPSDTQTYAMFSGRLRPGLSARATYAFSVPTSGQGDVTITISYAQGVPVIVLHGSAR